MLKAAFLDKNPLKNARNTNKYDSCLFVIKSFLEVIPWEQRARKCRAFISIKYYKSEKFLIAFL
jgi:hypothetical protein